MKRCTSCNRTCEDYAKICPNCGKPFSQGDIVNRPARNNVGGNMPGGGYGYQAPVTPLGYGRSPYDHTMEFSPEEISKGKAFAMVNYLLGIIGVFFCQMMRGSEYVKFHVRENCKYIVLKVLCSLAFGILAALFYGLAAATRTFVVYDGYYRVRMGGLAIVGNIFAGIGMVLVLAISVMQLISFFTVCSGRSVEGLVVRHFRFMK